MVVGSVSTSTIHTMWYGIFVVGYFADARQMVVGAFYTAKLMMATSCCMEIALTVMALSDAICLQLFSANSDPENRLDITESIAIGVSVDDDLIQRVVVFSRVCSLESRSVTQNCYTCRKAGSY